MMGAGEIVLPRRARQQPKPEICQGGDCGACALGGALALDVEALYERFSSRGITNRGEMARCLRCSVSNGLADRALDAPAEWPTNRHWASFGYPAVYEALPWFNHVRMALEAGYYGVAQIDYERNCGPDTNHWVLICGARSPSVAKPDVLTGDVLISCSPGGERWIEAREFLRTHGGYDALFVRPIGGGRHHG